MSLTRIASPSRIPRMPNAWSANEQRVANNTTLERCRVFQQPEVSLTDVFLPISIDRFFPSSLASLFRSRCQIFATAPGGNDIILIVLITRIRHVGCKMR
ncbi:hypothetical protein KC367_g81 [Hortaea werneckii]|nr:hypothetical protein KC367_g81 [Hortaea werneckii]